MWEVVAAHLPVRDRRRGGRALKYGHRLVIDTILHVPVSGCASRLVQHDLAPWDAAHRWFRLWSAQSACVGEAVGYDAGKKTRGRNRHLLVDTPGLLLVCVVRVMPPGPR